MEDLQFFSGLGLDALKNDIFTEEVGNLGDRQVTNTLLAVQDKDGEKKLVTLQKSDLSVKNWIKSLFFSDSPLAKKDYHLENVVHYTKEKLDEALKNGDGTDEYKNLKSFSEKIAYLKDKGKLSVADIKVLNNIYQIANRAHFYDHDKDGLFEAVSKTISSKDGKKTEQSKTSLITVYQGESLTSTAIKGEFKWNPMMNIRFVALEALKEGKIRTFKPLAELNVQLEFDKGLAVPKNLNQVIGEENLVKEGKAVCITFVESSGGDYIDECVLSANSPNLFKMYDSDTKVQAALRLFEKGEKIPYEALTPDEMVKLIDQKPEILYSIPEKFHEAIIKEKPELLRLPGEFKKNFFEAEPKRIQSLSPDFQKEILGSLKDHDSIKSIMPLAHEDAQIHIIEKFGDEKNGALHEHASTTIYPKILGNNPEGLANKSKVFQNKILSDKENLKKYLKFASLDVQSEFLGKGENYHFENLPYVSSELQMKQIFVKGIEKYFAEDPKRIALFPIDFQIALINRTAQVDYWKVEANWDLIKLLMPETDEEVKKHFISRGLRRNSKNVEILYHGLPEAFLKLIEEDPYSVCFLPDPLQIEFLSQGDNCKKYLKDATGAVAKYMVKQNRENIPYLNQFLIRTYRLVVELKTKLSLFENENGDLTWPDGTATGQNFDQLAEMIDKSYKSGFNDYIRLKQPESQEGKRSFLVGFKWNFYGQELGSVVQKVKTTGQDAIGKTTHYKSIEVNRKNLSSIAQGEIVEGKDKSVKLSLTREEGKLLSKQKRERTWDGIKNERYLRTKVIDDPIRGIQHKPEHWVLLIRGTNKGEENESVKLGNIGHQYSGGAVSSEIENWSGKNLFKGFSDLAFGLKHCHSKEIYLGSVTPEKILRDDEKKELVLSGFDEATEVTKPEDCTLQFPFTPYYICTQDTFELHDMVQKNDIGGYRNIREKMDVFALAVSMFTISTGGDLPCEYSDKGFAQDRISQETIIEKLKERFGDTEKTMRLGILIYMSLDPDHTQRPTSNEFDETMQEIAVM